MTTTMTKTMLNPNIHLVEGNSKLEGSDSINFLIFNITSQSTCPHKTSICEFICYAASEERRFPSVRKSRKENLLSTLENNFVEDMINHIEYQLSRKKNQEKTVFFRIHSAGDFYSQNYFDKWVMITNFFKDDDRIVFEAYTKSLPFILHHNPEDINITLVYSVMPDTDPMNIAIAKEHGLKTFNALPIGQIPENTFKCPGSCGNCSACYIKDNGINDIYTEYHGARAKTKME